MALPRTKQKSEKHIVEPATAKYILDSLKKSYPEFYPKNKREKRLKITKKLIISYEWTCRCPKCGEVVHVIKSHDSWVFDKCGGIGVECKCGFGQVINKKDLEDAEIFTGEEI